MEHLSDKNGAFTINYPDRIPLVYLPLPTTTGNTNSGSRTFQDFYDLPEREGWSIREDGRRKPRTKDRTLGQVTQRWLYFELLWQALGHLDGFSLGDFVETDYDGSSYITTKELPSYLERWMNCEKQSSNRDRVRRLVRIQQVLERARWFVSQFCSFEARNQWPVDRLLSLSFMVLGETLSRALTKIQRATRLQLPGWWIHDDSGAQGWGYSEHVLNKLGVGVSSSHMQEVWCKRTIHMLRSLVRRNTIGLLYLYALPDSSVRGPQHYGCSEDKCVAKNFVNTMGRLEPRELKPYHHCTADRDDHCFQDQSDSSERHSSLGRSRCEAWRGVKGVDLARIINNGNIPLVRYRDDRKEKDLDVIEMSPSFDKPYAIFSHVWSDGFGPCDDSIKNDPKANRLNVCVLDMFSRLFNKINVERSGKPGAVPEAFWIDTLAIPIQEQYKDERIRAIRRMHEIYTHAKYTIVLDLSLMQVTKGSGYAGPAMKITLSNWMTRMWTLQEAVLSKNIYFNFKDQVYLIHRLEDLYAEEDSRLHSCIPALARTYHHSILGDGRRRVYSEIFFSDGWQPEASFVAQVWKATQWRSTKHLHHETLSLATLLNADTDRFAGPSPHPEDSVDYKNECDERMSSLIYLLSAMSPCAIPPGTIFLPGEKLSAEGYRWAPRSWLSSQEVEPPDPLSVETKTKTRLTLPDGLEVEFPGFRLHELGINRNKLQIEDAFHFPTNFTLGEWYRVESIKEGERILDESKINDDRRLAIIVSRFPILNRQEIALLVAIKKIHSKMLYVEILNRAWISRCDNHSKLAIGFREGSEDLIGETLSTRQKWCVDGPPPRQDSHEDELPKKSFFAKNFEAMRRKTATFGRQ